MKKAIIIAVIIVLLFGCLCLIAFGRYQSAIYWVEEGKIFSKATSYVDEFPFLLELYDPGIVSYAYAGEAMECRRYNEAIKLLKPLADRNYRESVKMLEYCIEQLPQ